MEPTESRDVFAAVRGLRGDHTPARTVTPPLTNSHGLMNELSFAPEGYMDGEEETLSFGAGARGHGHEAIDALSDTEQEEEEAQEEEVLRRIDEALQRSRDSGDTLDLSRKGISNIGPLAVQRFRRGVGQENKGVWR